MVTRAECRKRGKATVVGAAAPGRGDECARVAGAQPPDGGRGRVGLALTAVLLLAAAVPACSTEITFPENREPFLYLMLNEVAPAGGGRVAQPAVLLRQIRADSAVFLEAESFEMRRASDGALFDWRNETLFGSGPFVELGGLDVQEGNYLLADSATSRGLGRTSLEPGATYELRVDLGDGEITGTVTVPDTFSVRITGTGDDRRAVWPDVDGAGGYSVRRTAEDGGTRLQRDTTVRLPPGTLSVTVRAFDPQSFGFLVDPDARRAGIEGGLGVLGAVQVAGQDVPGGAP